MPQILSYCLLIMPTRCLLDVNAFSQTVHLLLVKWGSWGRGKWKRRRKLNFWQRQQSVLKFSLLKSQKPCERVASLQGGEDSGAGQRDQFTYPVTCHRFPVPRHLPVSFLRLKGLADWRQIKRKSLFSVSGIPNWYLFCSDLDRQPPSIQQHHENPHSEQQHGWPDMDPRHHLPKLQDCGGSLDHHTQPAPQNLEWWENPVHITVRCSLALFWVFKAGFIDGI